MIQSDFHYLRAFCGRMLVLGLALFALPASADEDSGGPPEANGPLLECSLYNFDGDGSAYVDLSFTVTTEGSVRDPFVIRSDACEQSAIPSFESAAIKAVLDFKYRPRVIDGEAVEVDGVTTRITFRLEEDTEESEETGETDREEESVGPPD